jgi:hypothetical protein
MLYIQVILTIALLPRGYPWIENPPSSDYIAISPNRSVLVSALACNESDIENFTFELYTGYNGAKPRPVTTGILKNSSLSYQDAEGTGYVASQWQSGDCIEAAARVFNMQDLDYQSISILFTNRERSDNATFVFHLVSDKKTSTNNACDDINTSITDKDPVDTNMVIPLIENPPSSDYIAISPNRSVLVSARACDVPENFTFQLHTGYDGAQLKHDLNGLLVDNLLSFENAEATGYVAAEWRNDGCIEAAARVVNSKDGVQNVSIQFILNNGSAIMSSACFDIHLFSGELEEDINGICIVALTPSIFPTSTSVDGTSSIPPTTSTITDSITSAIIPTVTPTNSTPDITPTNSTSVINSAVLSVVIADALLTIAMVT